MKKVLTVFICLSALFISISSTVAYFTYETEGSYTELLFGQSNKKIGIEQIEWRRGRNGLEKIDDISLSSELVIREKAEYVEEDLKDKVSYILPSEEFGEEASVNLWRDVKNSFDKMVSIQNTGSVDVYVRTVFAFPLDVNYRLNRNDEWIWDVNGEVVIDDKSYVIYTAVYPEKVSPCDGTSPSLLEVVMDKEAQQRVSRVRVYAVSQAVSTDDCKSVEDAMERFPKIDVNLFSK